MSTESGRPAERLRVVHHHPGRIRVRSAVFRDGGELADKVRRRVAASPGFRALSHNPVSGSLLIEYQVGELDTEALLAEVAAEAGLAGVWDGLDGRGEPIDLAAAIAQGARAVNRVVREATSDRADLGVIIPGALLAAAVASLILRPDLPRWESLLYWSFTFFRDLNPSSEGAEGKAAVTAGQASTG